LIKRLLYEEFFLCLWIKRLFGLKTAANNRLLPGGTPLNLTRVHKCQLHSRKLKRVLIKNLVLFGLTQLRNLTAQINNIVAALGMNVTQLTNNNICALSKS